MFDPDQLRREYTGEVRRGPIRGADSLIARRDEAHPSQGGPSAVPDLHRQRVPPSQASPTATPLALTQWPPDHPPPAETPRPPRPSAYPPPEVRRARQAPRRTECCGGCRHIFSGRQCCVRRGCDSGAERPRTQCGPGAIRRGGGRRHHNRDPSRPRLDEHGQPPHVPNLFGSGVSGDGPPSASHV